jgi:uncharacterized membrane protein/glutaredoxin
MSSRRSKPTPWIHRWARPLIGVVAALGMLNTGYLTATKLFGGETACPTTGCHQVLSSTYAQVFGLPLSLFGFLAYGAMLVLALAPLVVNPEKDKPLRVELENWTWLFLFLGATAMLIFSGYLMFIMFSKFVSVYGANGICYYCLASALFALTMFVLTLIGREWEDSGQLVFSGLIVAMVTLVGTLGIYNLGNGGAKGSVAGSASPVAAVATASGPSEIALAQHLTKIGAKMYGAYWCPHCHEQKNLFGQQAVAQMPYVECDPGGANAKPEICQSEGVKGYPTWKVNGQTVSGVQTLQQLADMSGYQGPRDFKNSK